MKTSVAGLVLCLCMLLPCLLAAQPGGGRRSIQLTGGSNHDQGLYQQLANVGIEYRQADRRGRSFRIGIAYVFSQDRSRGTVTALVPDTLQVRTYTTSIGYFALSGALERERVFWRDLHLAAGLEGRLGYGGGGTDMQVEQFSGTVGLGTTGYARRDPHDVSLSAAMLQLRPYIGARVYPGKRLTVGVDFGPMMYSSWRFRNVGRGSEYAMYTFLLTGQLRVGYRF